MATIYFTNNADSGDGSCRAAWASASAGDVITPDPKSFSGDTIEILLASQWAARSIALTLDGGDFRIILNGQGTQRFTAGTSANIEHTFRNVDFKNFTRTDQTTVAPAYYSGLGSLTFENCKFYGNVGPTGSSFIRTASSVAATLTFINCVAYDNGTTGYGRIIYASASTVTLTGCTFYAVAATGSTVTDSGCILISDPNDLTAAGFVSAQSFDFRLTPDSPNLTGGLTSGTDILGHTRDGALGAYAGSWFVVGANASESITDRVVVDYVELEDTATVNFEAQDAALTARRGSTVGAASLEASAGVTGYFAAPDLDVSDATLSGVVACYYGANVTSFAAEFVDESTVGFTITKTTAAAVLVERRVGSSWSVVSVDAGASTRVPNVTTTTTFRSYDGARFLTSTVSVGDGSIFWRILDWAVVDTSGGDGSDAWKVEAWAVDPEIEKD